MSAEGAWFGQVVAYTDGARSRLDSYTAAVTAAVGTPVGTNVNYQAALAELLRVPELCEGVLGQAPTDRTGEVGKVLRQHAEAVKAFAERWDIYLSHNDVAAKTEAEAFRDQTVVLSQRASHLIGQIRGTGGKPRRQPIPERVRHEVWRRDQGQCVDCGSRDRLEYDHIVPVARGGSNTARNIELRCETCNRRKGAKV